MTRLLGKCLWGAASWWHRRRLRGAARLYAMAGQIFNCEPLLVARTRHGVKFELTPRHYIDTEVLHHGYYEIEVLDAILDHLQPGDVFWDIGANFGLHAVTVAKLRSDCTVVAFEPNPEMVSRMIRNAERNGVAISIVPGAAWSRASVERLTLPNSVNPGMARVGTTGDSADAGHPTLEVPCFSGDDYIACGGIPAPSLIKIDTEGSEEAVLEGLRQTLRSHAVRVVVFEEQVQAAESRAVRSILETAGFSIEKLEAARREAHVNCIALREK